jgi:hypothetical protein
MIAGSPYSGAFLFLRSGFQTTELAFDEVVVLIEALGQLSQHPLVALGGVIAFRLVCQANGREASLGFDVGHATSIRSLPHEIYRMDLRQKRT